MLIQFVIIKFTMLPKATISMNRDNRRPFRLIPMLEILWGILSIKETRLRKATPGELECGGESIIPSVFCMTLQKALW